MAQNLPKVIVMSGATGFVGGFLKKVFTEQGWTVVALARKDFEQTSQTLADTIRGSDVVVNLAGAPIIGKWTEAYKKILYDSRVNVTRKLVEACSILDSRPGIFISTSAVGYYTDHGIHTEENNVHADGFLGELAAAWEAEAERASELAIRKVIFRFGVVLGKGGGALEKMAVPFRFGLGGKIGSGKQAFSWIHILDLAKAYVQAITDPSFEGVYNLTSPNPTTNLGLTRVLGNVLKRPTVLMVPEFVLRLQFGEGAQILTGGQHALPKRLMEKGFEFDYANLEDAVRDCFS